MQSVLHPQETGFDLASTLDKIAHWLPTQGPLKDFVHHNTLHTLEHLPFAEAVRIASRVFGAAAYLEPEWYRHAYHNGRITPRALDRALDASGREGADREALRSQLLAPPPPFAPPRSAARSGIRCLWVGKGINFDSLIRPALFKLLSDFLDQGISIWRFPHPDLRFWESVGKLVRESWLPLAPLSDPACQELLELPPEHATLRCLERIVGSEAHYARYLLEQCLSHPGWSGMVRVVETNPGAIRKRRRITLGELVALELVMELGWLRRKLGEHFPALFDGSGPTPVFSRLSAQVPSEMERMQETWQSALEWTLYEDVLSALEKRQPPAPLPPPFAQIFLCLDDRNGSVRRHIEEVEPAIGTFSTAGFFAMDFVYQGPRDAQPEQYCPNILKPRHLVRERVVGGHRMMQLLRESDEPTQDGYLPGYTIAEMADRVQSILTSTGCTRELAPLIVIAGHGSTSRNNPHFAAYDCGACSGRPGAPNSRAFCWMANHPKVRAELGRRGLSVPESTWFQAALLDSTRDELSYFDPEDLPLSHRQAFERFDRAMREVFRRNAKERCRRFALVPADLTPVQALEAVRQRSTSLFEPRPELNHATNALAIVGRRELTRGLFLDRRAFLSSYDPEQDPQGEILATVLRAVIPVCGGINLEYYFSRVDNIVYGAGTKLPHNVVSLIGVANGVEGDLRTGLPSQMIEAHDPLRLLVIVEQKPAIALRALTKHPEIFHWVDKRWVHLACFCPSEKRAYFFQDGEFQPDRWARDSLPVAPDSLSIIDRCRENIPVHEIRGGQS